jgi:hypothetical protein
MLGEDDKLLENVAPEAVARDVSYQSAAKAETAGSVEDLILTRLATYGLSAAQASVLLACRVGS